MRVTPLNDRQPRSVVTAHNNITRHKRATVDQAEAIWRDEQARERVSLEKISGRRPAEVTAQSFGLQPLREVAPHLFQEWVSRYLAVVEQAVAQRTYQEEHDISGELRGIAEQLSFLKAGPRDVVDVHIAALQHLTARHTQVHTHAEEARLLILELMGNLLSIYRNTSLGHGALLHSLGG